MLARTIIILIALTTSALALLPSLSQFLVAQTLPTWAGFRWQDCGNDNYALRVTQLSVHPDPPAKDADLIISGNGTTNALITDGSYVDVAVWAWIVIAWKQVYTGHLDVCQELGRAGLPFKCPLGPGKYGMTRSIHIGSIPFLNYFQIEVRGKTQEGKELVCLNLNLDF